jgi:hypothetical protein
MSSLLNTYIAVLSMGGFVLLLILSLFAFLNMEALKIKQGRHIYSGISLLISSIVLKTFYLDLFGNRLVIYLQSF